ncbi:hypothetical protein D9V87_01380 [Bacteroidetes/Chlorobi group bacterium MS-B_bin-24]|jgi:copper chaperone NosL|nr:MAG: hypothetical protein D9V87_01380 [Bacteroidetes/Chlorobi group bacterium MS-B_bin-24]
MLNINRRGNIMNFLLLISVIGLLFFGCSRGPEPIDYGKDACAACKMTIMDNKYAAEIVTKKGKVYKFDAIECLFNFKAKNLKEEDIFSEWVCDFSDPGKLINLRKAYFLHTEAFQSPMGLDVLAVATKDKVKEIQTKYGGHIMNYNEVRDFAIQRKMMNEMEMKH